MRFKFAIIFFLSLLGCAKKNAPTPTPLHYVPQNSAVIIKINDKLAFSNELENSHLLRSLSQTKAYTAIVDKINMLRYLHTNAESILAFVESEENNFETVFIAQNLDDLVQLEDMPERKVEQIPYAGKNIDKYTLGETIFFVSVFEDKIIVSSTRILIENLIQNERQLSLDPSLSRLYQIANDQNSATVFINTDKGKSILAPILANDRHLDISRFSDWISLDMDTDKDHLRLNGISTVNGSLPKFIDLFQNTHALDNRTPNLAPGSSKAILSYTFDHYGTFADNQMEYLGRSQAMDTTFNAVEEIGSVYLDGEKAIILHTNGSEQILNFLDGSKKSSEEYQGNEIVALSKVDFLNHYFDPLVSDYSANYYTVLENAFVFATSAEILKIFITNYKNGTTFEKTSTFKTAKEQLADESSILFVSDSGGTEYFINSYFDQGFSKDIHTMDWAEYTFAAQIVAENNFHHTNILFQKIAHETTLNKTTPFFTLQLDTEIATAPQFVKNHTTNKEEIVLQDQDNVLYLISTEGNIIWKKQLEGRVQGRIEQVDIYRNGRLQLAFTTNNRFMILDRNGKEVPPFTFSFEGGNLNPLAVFDYEGKKDYRFVVTQGTKLFMYNRLGEIVKGFKFTQAEQPISGTPKHFRIGKNDYVALKQEDGQLKILSRTGDVRVPVKEKITFSDNEILLHKNKFTVTDNKGRLYQIDEKGKLTTANLNLLPDHGIDATTNTLVMMNDNELTIRSKKVELELGVYSKPRIFYLNDKIYVSVTDIQNQKIYLFDSQAEPISNFPVPGQSLIDLSDMDNDHKLELLAKDQDNSIIVYKIN